MLQAVHRKSFTQLSANIRSKDPGIVGMLQAVHRKGFTQLSAKFRSKDPGIVRMLKAVHRKSTAINSINPR